ncbi:FHA domain-containing protein [Variovorax dokdonensis]|uniref:FHA domain-containing protein n=1 Tax=Variovorax dokdonensis TaxID=344883 RepID=A0ABT7NAI5_9BURK|nr:FHA domain-containing protein [Variovorax dokdonensis]MDM0044890.1 FHA domain-containing protein [Variovorax dokdonensis]
MRHGGTAATICLLYVYIVEFLRMPKLILMDAAGNIRQLPVQPPCVTLGRSATNDLPLDSRRVSRTHAVIEFDGPRAFLVDLHSLNGTIVNGELIDRHLLAHGDCIEIGNFELRYAALDEVLSTEEALRLLTAPLPQTSAPADWDHATMPAEAESGKDKEKWWY